MSLKKDITFLGLDYKKELLKIFAINLILGGFLAFIIIFSKEIYIIAFGILTVVTFDYILLSSFSSKRKATMRNRKDEFIQLISYFSIYLSNDMNVYHAFECIIPFASEWMRDELKKLLSDIDKDKSIVPYIEFAKKFESSDIENVINAIYQINEDDNVSRLARFDLVFTNLKNINRKEQLDSKGKSLDLLNNLAIFGAGFIAILLTIGVTNIIGGMLNGV